MVSMLNFDKRYIYRIYTYVIRFSIWDFNGSDFLSVTPCTLYIFAEVSEEPAVSSIYLLDGGNRYLRNVSKYPSDHIRSHCRRHSATKVMSRSPKIIN